MPPEVSDIQWVSDDWIPEETAHQNLLDFWHKYGRHNDQKKLTIDALDPTVMPKLLKNLMLLDVIDNGFDARYRVYGTNVASHAGTDWTGKLVSEMNRIERTHYALYFRSCYRAVYRQEVPLYTVHESPNWHSAKYWKRLIIPVFDTQGQEVKRFLVGNLPIKCYVMSSDEREHIKKRIAANAAQGNQNH